jgi:hypothetical protein
VRIIRFPSIKLYGTLSTQISMPARANFDVRAVATGKCQTGMKAKVTKSDESLVCVVEGGLAKEKRGQTCRAVPRCIIPTNND